MLGTENQGIESRKPVRRLVPLTFPTLHVPKLTGYAPGPPSVLAIDERSARTIGLIGFGRGTEPPRTTHWER